MSETHLSGEDVPNPAGGESGEDAPDAQAPALEGGEAQAETPGAENDPLKAAQEALARSRGWKPEQEWRGDKPPNFIADPAEYNSWHERSNLRLKEETDALRREIGELTRVSQKNFEMLRSSKDAEISRLKDAAEKRRRDAAANADVDAYDEATREIKALETAAGQSAPPPAQPQHGQPPAPGQPYPPQSQPPANNPNADPNFVAWHRDNAWYQTDPMRTKWAEAVAAREVQMRGLTPQHGRAYYDAISEVVNRDFGAPAGERPPQRQAAAPSGGGKPANRESFDAIPADDRKAFTETLVKKYNLYSNDAKGRAEYAKAYWQDKRAQGAVR